MIIIQTKDHYYIARYLSKEIGLCFCPLKSMAFVLGSVFPDINVFSYFKGNGLKGHSYKYSRKIISDTMDHADCEKVKSCADWFRVGVALHYVQDSFTYAHDECFTGGIVKHFEYESRLHEVLLSYFREITGKAPSNKIPDGLSKPLYRLYKSYGTVKKHTTGSDTAYILMSSMSFLRGIQQ